MEPEDPRSDGLGRAIRVIRTGQDLSRKELAERAGLSYSYLAEIESSAKLPSTKALTQLSKALGVAVHELMEAAHRWETSPPPHSYEELRDVTRFSIRRASTELDESPAAARRARGTRSASGPASFMGRGGADQAAADTAELLELLAGLSAEDRERLLDLARRLAAGD